MPIYNGRKYSKSEIILKCSQVKIGKEDENLPLSDQVNKKYQHLGIPSSFCCKTRKNNEKIQIQNLTDEEIVKVLLNKPKQIVLKLLKNKSLSTSLQFKDKKTQIFYYSLIIIQERGKNENVKNEFEQKLIQILFEENLNIREYLKYCLIKFSNETVLSFMNSYSWNINSISSFLTFLAPKFYPSVIQIWFENDFEAIHSLFSRLNSMEIDEKTKFKKSVFLDLFRYKSFKKAVFNGNLSLEFILGLKEYANRPDFDYFYNKFNIYRKIESDFEKLPKDADQFSFFTKWNKDSGDLIKIQRYQAVVGHSIMFNEWVFDNLDSLLLIFQNLDNYSSELTFPIFKSLIKFNGIFITKHENEELNANLSQVSLKNNNVKKTTSSGLSPTISLLLAHSRSIINKLFEKLRSNENYFRTVASLFVNPPDSTIQKLLTQDFSIEVSEVLKLINQGFENELILFFKQQKVSSYLHLIDEWSFPFFLRFFASQEFNNQDAILILKYIQNINFGNASQKSIEKFTTLIYAIYNKICSIESQDIFNNIPDQLKYIYCLRHKSFSLQYKAINKCNLTTAPIIHELYKKDENSNENKEIKNNLEYNSVISVAQPSEFYYQIATSNLIYFDENNLIYSLFLNNFILRSDSLHLTFLYFDKFLNQVTNSLTKDEIISFVSNPYDWSYFFKNNNDLNQIQSALKIQKDFKLSDQVSFISQFNFTDKYSLFVLFEKLYNILMNGTSIEKIFILNFINPSLLSKNHILKFIDCVIPLLNSSNRILCELSKLKFRALKVETQEIQNILPEIIQCFESKGYFMEFFNRFENIFFNNYLCFNSLNIIVQLLFRYLDTNTKECLNILSRIINITKDKDIKHISGLVFSNISKFVVNNNFYTTEALEVASQFCLYAKYEDFEILIKNNHALRICNYLVGILKVKGETELNKRIIERVIFGDDQQEVVNSSIEPSFIAAACELVEFNKYMKYFVPVIKNLFISTKIESRQIACKAIKSLFLSPSLEEFKEDLKEFLIELCVTPDHNIRLSILDVLDYNPIIFILRNDNHSLVKKKAYDIWKLKVSNTNKELKSIYREVISFLKYFDHSIFSIALKSTINEMATKYLIILETYLSEPDVPDKFKEIILIESVKIGKLTSQAISFCSENFSPDLFKFLFKNVNIRESLVENSNKDLLLDICAEDSDLALFLFTMTADPIYIDYLTFAQKIDLIKNHHIASKTVSINDENMIFILQSVESSIEIEHLLLKLHPSFSYFYLSVNRVNYGCLDRLFERVFDVCFGLDELVNERNVLHLRNCSLERLEDKKNLLLLFIKLDDRRSFDKVVEIIKNYECQLDQENIFNVLGFLLRNFLSKNRKPDSQDCILKIYENTTCELGFFRNIIEDSIVKH